MINAFFVFCFSYSVQFLDKNVQQWNEENKREVMIWAQMAMCDSKTITILKSYLSLSKTLTRAAKNSLI